MSSMIGRKSEDFSWALKDEPVLEEERKVKNYHKKTENGMSAEDELRRRSVGDVTE